ncbi:DUF1772 domain-containing protein [Roseiarcaceae bacterium H3SJ34-1]|uniref:DUF1772 domain-containing protein n=1 Tax=Terripilifer ovatus TaxID=3032367 RepID=UPI003AB95DEB|nr:DUF1772 domain-containing protein [Roseiarcaceae bacterium H3SJ34-1]
MPQLKVRSLKMLALVLGALILVPSGAHLLEVTHKISMDRDTYFAVQRIYAGWALSGIAILAAVVIDLALFFRLRGQEPSAAFSALLSAGLIIVGLVVFFIWVYPANVVTANWTTQPADWEPLRRQWEYGHVAIAIATFAAFVAIASCAVGPSSTPRS